MTAIPFPGITAPGRHDGQGGRLINAYPEKRSDGRVALSRVPGLLQRAAVPDQAGVRGLIEINGVVLAAYPDAIYAITRVSGAYTVTELGELPGDEPVYFARNNKQPTPDIVAVTGGTAYQVYIDAAPDLYPDADVGGPNDVAFLQGYFVFSYGNAKLQASGINDTTIDTLDYTYAESRPDGLYRVLAYADNVVAFGPSSVEIYRNTGEATGFPFSLLGTIPRGLIAAGAVAGQDAGFSNQLLFVGDDRIVYRLDGTAPVRVSTHEIERKLQGLASTDDLVASVHMHSGHAVWALSCASWTYCYDLTMNVWYERHSRGLVRWRVARTVRAFGMWLAGTTDDGSVYEITEATQTEGAEEIRSVIVSSGMTAFPKGGSGYALALDIESSAGNAAGATSPEIDPVASVAWSLTGGATWGTPLLRALPKQGQYNTRVTVSRLGLARAKSLCVRVECSDPVPFSLYGGDVTAQPRA